jgi:hypothetical protein
MWLGWVSGKSAWHFQRRLWERYGLVLQFGEYSEIQRSIRSGACHHVVRGKRDHVWFVPLQGHIIAVVAEPMTCRLITVLPRDLLQGRCVRIAATARDKPKSAAARVWDEVTARRDGATVAAGQ